MSLNAYQSNPALRDAAIERLRRNAASQGLAPGPLKWDGTKGSLVGCILESDDLTQWEHTLGLPQWLATTADGVAAAQESVDAALAFGIDLLSAVRPGVDVSRVGSAVVMSVLADADEFIGKMTDIPAELKHLSEQVQDLQRRVLEGERPAPAEWRLVRCAATALTDTVEPELLKSLATCVETAAWDPTTSKAVVFDTLRVYSKAAGHKADMESGFTVEHDNDIRAHLKLMWDTHLAAKPELQEQGITVFSLLEEHHPDVAAKVKWKTQLDRDAYAYANRRAADVLIAQLKRT
ncbi:hypothetical protein SAMN05216517_10932 [Janthinobacterium sp. OK676]|uniref:hypothetical protein n=1 Tax=unclassified Janthinobacterium TaxID=2610881 RepID=UPI000883A6DE|nr:MULTISPECIES: hypothetical protein [unclassified Janthinobacterium]PKB13803.1 hypothetical protein CLU91_5419 [Janthinobacterium sp. 64]SDN22109.1 hypothetical protein SAMN05216517_10932 [Janthinobacterium sp. OK676]